MENFSWYHRFQHIFANLLIYQTHFFRKFGRFFSQKYIFDQFFVRIWNFGSYDRNQRIFANFLIYQAHFFGNLAEKIPFEQFFTKKWGLRIY